jgi:hypothetical protein
MGACIMYSFWREHVVGKYWMSHSHPAPENAVGGVEGGASVDDTSSSAGG